MTGIVGGRLKEKLYSEVLICLVDGYVEWLGVSHAELGVLVRRFSLKGAVLGGNGKDESLALCWPLVLLLFAGVNVLFLFV